jgi:pyrroloquinoline-quinone synthase
MTHETFWASVESCLAEFDLLKHPFYKAWSAGTLTTNDLSKYAANYYHHVQAFPGYLEKLEQRLPQGALREHIEQHRADELGGYERGQRSHADIWLDFAESMGASAEKVRESVPVSGISSLVSKFDSIATKSSPTAALAAFYAYESQIPRVAEFKGDALRANYGADEKCTSYFDIHAVADIAHAQSWRELINVELNAAGPAKEELAKEAIDTCRDAATSLWKALDAMLEMCDCQVAC